MSYPVVQDYNNHLGLNGFFGNLLKGIATAVGGMIGGGVGALVVTIGAYAIDRYVFGNQNASLQILGFTIIAPASGMTGFLNNLNIKKSANSDELNTWVEKRFKRYILDLAKIIRIEGQENILLSETYRNKVNEVLKSLAVAATYYELQEKTKGLNGLIDLEDVEVNSESKATVIYSFLNAIKEAYILALREAGIEPSVKLQKVNLSGYVGRKVERYNFESTQAIEVEFFVQPGTGVKPTSVTGIEIEDIKKPKPKPKPIFPVNNDTVKTPVLPTSTEEPTATVATGKTKNASVFGWSLAALIGGALMFKKKNKKK